jgi:SynChlorMet cassette protein ScmC
MPIASDIGLRDLLSPDPPGREGAGSRDTFGLSLADGNCWRLSAGASAAAWLKELAAVMRLPAAPPDGRPELIFTEEPPPRDPEALGFQREEIVWAGKGQQPLRFWRRPGHPGALCCLHNDGKEEYRIMNMWNCLAIVYLETLWRGGLPLHAGLAVRDGRGIILAAPGDTGKSTTCRRLPPPWKFLADDETLITLTPQGRYLAHPFPTWSDFLLQRMAFSPPGRSWDVHRTAPVRAIFFLEQHPADEVIPLQTGQAAVFIQQSAIQVFTPAWHALPPEVVLPRRQQVFQNAADLAVRVPAYLLRLSLHGRFWEELDRLPELR